MPSFKRYYQGEDFPFEVIFTDEFQNVSNFSEFSEIRSYVYTDSCLIQKFSTISRDGFDVIQLNDNILSGIVTKEYSSFFKPGAIFIEIIGIKQNSELKYDIGKTTIGILKKSLIKIEKSEEEIFLTLSKYKIEFEDSGGFEHIEVTIVGTENKSFSIDGLPSWVSVSNKTQTGFTLTASQNPTDDDRSAILTVKLDNYPAQQKQLSILQEGSWLSEFVFDVVTTVANENVKRIVNMGAVESGEAMFNYDDGSPIEIKTVSKSQAVTVDDQLGGTVTVLVGTDFGHTFATAGTHTVIIKIRRGVNLFRFSSLESDTIVSDSGAAFLPNPYIRTIRKIKSESLESGSKLFAGVINGSFASEFQGLETPNMVNFDYMFENFGNKGTNTYTATDRLRLPANMYQHITKKNSVTQAIRTYYGSGFEAIEKSMLSFAADNTLVNVRECFRFMRNVGANFNAKYGTPTNFRDLLNNFSEFVESDIFQNQKNIQVFEGCFNAINDLFGNMSSGYSIKWIIKKDLFKNNVANNVNISWMFNKCTRALIESNLFAHLGNGQRIQKMDGCFWNMNQSNQRFGGTDFDAVELGFNGNRIDQHPDSLFPEASYPNMVSMVGAFGFATPTNTKRDVEYGWQALSGQTSFNQVFNTPITRYSTLNGAAITVLMNNTTIAAFLSRFPNVTATSGIDPMALTVVDGAAFNFMDFDAQDLNNAMKAADFNTYNARPDVKQYKVIN